MASLGFWDDPDGPWDRLVLNGMPWPGAWQVSCECERDIDVKKSKGKDGAHVKDHGYRPASIKLRGTIVTEAEWQQMQTLLPELHPRKKGAERRVITVDHPALALMGVRKLYVQKIDSPTIGDKGLEFDIQCLEWTPPKEVKKKKGGPIEWSARQRAANANAGEFKPLRLEGTGQIFDDNVQRDFGGNYHGYTFSPADGGKAAEDARKTREIQALLGKSQAPKQKRLTTWELIGK